MPPLHGLTLVLGGRGSGKTTLLQALVKHGGARHGARFVIWDRLGHWLPSAYPTARIVTRSTPEAISRLAIKLAPCTLVVDEIDLYAPSSRPIPESSAVYEILHMGRQACAYGEFRRPGPVALVGAARRPANVRTDLKDLADRVYLGRMTGRSNLAWVEDLAGREIAERLPSFRTGEFLMRDTS